MIIEQTLTAPGTQFFGRNSTPIETNIETTFGYYSGDGTFRMTIKRSLSDWAEITFTAKQVRQIIVAWMRGLNAKKAKGSSKTDNEIQE